MRKGAFRTGNIVCNSSPVDIRTTQLVPGTALRFCEGRGRPGVPSFTPPTQAYAEFSCGQPNSVLIRVSYWKMLVCNCDGRRIGLTPMSTKGAMATGPAMVMRYSRLPVN